MVLMMVLIADLIQILTNLKINQTNQINQTSLDQTNRMMIQINLDLIPIQVNLTNHILVTLIIQINMILKIIAKQTV